MTTSEHPDRFRFIVATDEPDGNGNQADIEGWDLTRYNQNPVVFFNHHWHQPPIGRTESIDIQDHRLVATIQLSPTPFAQQVALLIADNFIRGASVGWKPLTWEWRRDPTGIPLGIHSSQQELLEISIVGLPANADTLRATRSAEHTNMAGIEEWLALSTSANDNLDAIIGSVPPPDNLIQLANIYPPDQHETTILRQLQTWNQLHRG